jgi:hypothetical protein
VSHDGALSLHVCACSGILLPPVLAPLAALTDSGVRVSSHLLTPPMSAPHGHHTHTTHTTHITRITEEAAEAEELIRQHLQEQAGGAQVEL